MASVATFIGDPAHSEETKKREPRSAQIRHRCTTRSSELLPPYEKYSRLYPRLPRPTLPLWSAVKPVQARNSLLAPSIGGAGAPRALLSASIALLSRAT